MWELHFRNYLLICALQWLLGSFSCVCAFILKPLSPVRLPPSMSQLWFRHLKIPRRRGQAQIVAASADTEAFGSRHELHFWLLGATNASWQIFCDCIKSCQMPQCQPHDLSLLSRPRKIWRLMLVWRRRSYVSAHDRKIIPLFEMGVIHDCTAVFSWNG